jgi:hypothetical protein
MIKIVDCKEPLVNLKENFSNCFQKTQPLSYQELGVLKIDKRKFLTHIKRISRKSSLTGQKIKY